MFNRRHDVSLFYDFELFIHLIESASLDMEKHAMLSPAKYWRIPCDQNVEPLQPSCLARTTGQSGIATYAWSWNT